MWLVFTDIHLSEYKAFSTVNEKGINTRLLKQVDVFRQVRAIARQYKVTNIFFLGDLFHSQAATISKIVYNTAFYLIQALATEAPVYLLTGNHDLFVNIHMFTPFSSIPHTTIVNNTTKVLIDGATVHLVPWGGTLRKPITKNAYCFGHFGIDGATDGRIKLPTHNLDVDPHALAEYKLVLAGHYHTRQQLGDHIYHTGAVMANLFTDSSEDRGVWIIDPSESTFKFLPIKSPKFITYPCSKPDDVDQFFRESYNDYDYFRLLISSDDIHIGDVKDNVRIEYDIDPTSSTELVLTDPADIINLKNIIVDFIDNSNTALNKDTLKAKSLELLDI